jgi:Right handed beta helix region
MKGRTILLGVAASAFAAVALAASASAGGTTRYVAPGGSDTANNCTSKKKPCQHIQYAVDIASAGDTISLDKGTYVEQVTIAKSLQLKGEDDKSVIQAPSSMTPDADGRTNIVEITGASTSVDASHVSVAGPMPVCNGSGIAVIGDATLSIDHASVRNIGPSSQSIACMDGEGIRAGTQRHSSIAQIGHINASHVEVTGYNKNGIVVSGAGSTGDLDHNTVTANANPFFATNGIEAFSGGVFSADHNTVTGNECNNLVFGQCGADFLNDTQSNGFLVYDGGPGVTMDHNDVTGNDIGVSLTGSGPPSGVVLDHNKFNENRYVGVFVDSGATNLTVSHNETKKNGEYGIYLGSTQQYGPPTYNGSGSFADNEAKDNGSGNPAFYDLWWDGTGTPTFHHNHCGTAFPSKAAWDCK